MNAKWLSTLLIVLVVTLRWSLAWSQPETLLYPPNATFTTKAITPFAIEGLTMDARRDFYTTGRQTDTTKKCPVWRINANSATRVSVGFIPNSLAAPCNPSGIAFDSMGNLYIADAASPGSVWKVSPDPTGCASDDSTSSVCTAIANSTSSSPTNPFAKVVPGTNGVAFDRDGNLWTGDGTTGLGRVWKIGLGGGDCTLRAETNCEEVFRIQPMNNSVAFEGDVPNPGVGRVNSTIQPPQPGLPQGSVNPQNLVANGLAFNTDGDLFVADTARGALWQVKFESDGTLKSHVGCDETFHPNTLCLNHIFVADPRLEGADGIALDQNGNIWVSINERNAIVIFGKGVSAEVFRNPMNPNSRLRNSSATGEGNKKILEFPTSPFLLGNQFCTANSDGNRRDNSPNTDGEVNSSGPVGLRGKISCMDQDLTSPGLPLPVQ